MSVAIEVKTLTDKQKRRLEKDLTIELTHPKIGTIIAYRVSDDDQLVYIPYDYGRKHGFLPPSGSSFPRISPSAKFVGELYPEQKNKRKEAIDNLNSIGTTIMSLNCGFGKTITAINIALKIRLRDLVIVTRLLLIDQWQKAINNFASDVQVHILLPDKPYLHVEADIFVINAINIKKFNHGFLQKFGLVIVDECHLIMSTILSQGMQFLTPRYLLALSATPYRYDDGDKLINLHFGKARVTCELKRKHIVRVVRTDFKPTIEFNEKRKKINWNLVLNSLSEMKARNALICDITIEILTNEPDRNILILTKRVEQVQVLEAEMKKKGVSSVTTLFGSKRDFDRTAKILVACIQKCSVGFDHPILDTLILACDTDAYFIQTLGRVFRKKDTTPLIVDIVDNHASLHRHFLLRKKVYTSIGGVFS